MLWTDTVFRNCLQEVYILVNILGLLTCGLGVFSKTKVSLKSVLISLESLLMPLYKG